MRTLRTCLEYEATCRPEIADLMARAEYLTDEELDQAVVPLPWFRDALRELRDERKGETAMRITQAVIGDYVVDGEVPDPQGHTVQWMGDDTYVNVGRTELLLKYGELVWMGGEGAWIDTVFCPRPDGRIIQMSKSLGMMTRNEYREALREKRIRYAPADIQTIDLTGDQARGPTGALARYGVRFS